MKKTFFLLLFLLSITSAFGQQRRSALDETPTFPPTNTSSTTETTTPAPVTTPKRYSKTALIVTGGIILANHFCANWQPCAEMTGQYSQNTVPEQSQMYRSRQNTNLTNLTIRPLLQPRTIIFPIRRKN